MDHEIGGIDLIRWQSRRNRRPRPGVSFWTALLVVCALTGCSTLAAQLFGVLPWSGPLAVVPAALVLLAAVVQIVAFARSAIAWLVG